MSKPLAKKEVLEQLKICMQKEIHMMRELLANMHREELSLQFQDKTSWEQVMTERAQMIGRLKSLRDSRLQVTEQFENQESYQDSDVIEIYSLRDQILALAEKMNQIQSRNEYLSEHKVLQEPRPNHYSSPSTNLSPRRKSSIATYPPKK